MTQKVTIDGKATLFWLLLCAGVLDAQALGLGRLQGTALIGRPLDVSVQIQTDPGEDSAALCLDVEVFHADARQDQRLVRVTLDAVAAGQIANARIVSSTPVDEPVVTVLLRAGCAQKSARRYVLLADPPSEGLASAVPLVAPAVLVEPAVPASAPATVATATPVVSGPAAGLTSQPLAPTTSAATAALPLAPVAKPVSAPIPPKPVAAPVTPPVTPQVTPQVTPPAANLPARAAPPTGPRLTLSPALAPASAAVLAVAAPVAADAAAQKIQALERDMKAALARSARLEASLTDMKTRLQQAESERWPSELLYGLGALVLASLTAVALLWARLRRLQADRGEWWSHSVMNQAEPAADLDRSMVPSMTPTLAVAAAAVASQPSPAPASVQSVDVQPEPAQAETEPAQDPVANSAEPALAGAEPSLDLDNLIDFDPSQGKQPPAALS
jgi:hypothetical protein